MSGPDPSDSVAARGARADPGASISFDGRELRDLALAWVALGVAFAIFLNPGLLQSLLAGTAPPTAGLVELALALSTAGLGFLLHELAHKVVAVRFGQAAAFRADYRMLGFTVVSALAGFLFAAPGAVVHRGRITPRENGLISLAGPVTNLLLAALFLPLSSLGPGLVALVGAQGVGINLLLAGFNMIPFGPLDGRKVLAWNKLVYAVVAVPSIGLAVSVFLL